MLLVFFPAMFYIGREYTQAEYRYIADYCNNKREHMPWYAPFLFRSWTLKGFTDWLYPSMISLIIYVLFYIVFN